MLRAHVIKHRVVHDERLDVFVKRHGAQHAFIEAG